MSIPIRFDGRDGIRYPMTRCLGLQILRIFNNLQLIRYEWFLDPFIKVLLTFDFSHYSGGRVSSGSDGAGGRVVDVDQQQARPEGSCNRTARVGKEEPSSNLFALFLFFAPYKLSALHFLCNTRYKKHVTSLCFLSFNSQCLLISIHFWF